MFDTAERSTANTVNQFFNFVLSLVVKLFFGVLAAVFAVSLLAAGLVYLGFASVRFLLTGRKPAVAVMFTQLRQFRQSAADGVWPGASHGPHGQPASTADVVDVEVREIGRDRREG